MEVPYKLKEAITNKVIIIKATLYLLITLHVYLKAELLLFNLKLKLIL